MGNTQEFFIRLYEQSSRFGSMAGTHAGIGTNRRAPRRSRGALTVRAVRHTTDDGTGVVVFAASLFALLASHVFHQFRS